MPASTRPLRLTGLTDRTFGVEIEFLSSTTASAVVREMRAVGLECRDESYNHSNRPHWKVVYDGSCGNELVSPILSGEDGLRQVRLASQALIAAGAKVDRRCGFHVHHEGRDLTVKDIRTLARLVNRFKPVVDGLLPPSRRNAYYASPFTTEELDRLEAATEKCCGLRSYDYRAARGEGSSSHRSCRLVAGSRRRRVCQACACQRYRSLNLRALHQHGTVEFRQHSGTVEAEKMVAWILLTQGLVEKAKDGRSRTTQVKPNGDGFKNLLRAAGLQNCAPHGHKVAPEHKALAKEVAKTLRARAKKFGVIELRDNSARRSRAGQTTPRTARTARERVEAALAAATTSQVATATTEV